MLLAMRPDERDQLSKHVYLSGAKGTTKRRPGHTVCQLRVSGLRVQRLSERTTPSEGHRRFISELVGIAWSSGHCSFMGRHGIATKCR